MTASDDDKTPESEELPEEGSGRIARAKARAEEAKKTGAEILAREEQHRLSVRIAVEAFNRDRRFAGGLLAGGLAFRLFLWLLPFSLVVVALLGSVSSRLEQPASELAERAGLSAALAGTVAKAVHDSGQGRWYLLVIGVVLLLWAGMGVLKAVRLISGLAWQVPPKMNLNPLVSSATVFVVVGAIFGVRLIAAWLHSGPLSTDILTLAAETIWLVAVATWVFWKLPHSPDVGWQVMVPGGVLVAFGVLVSRLITAVYFVGRLDRVDDLYGALGVASVFLAWLYIIARLWVAATSLNASVYGASANTPSTGADDG